MNRVRASHVLFRLVVVICWLNGISASAQATQAARFRILVVANDRPTADAIVRIGVNAARTDTAGVAEFVVDSGPQMIIASKLGFRPDSLLVLARPGMDTTVSLSLAPVAATLSTVVVTVARTEQRIEDVPIRVEILAGEDVGEKSAMRPGDLTQMVAEIPGVRVQPMASGATGGSLRIQGFRSQYTQFLTDGLPLTGATDAGLSLVQIPPLDLAQVEVVKGGASALYGPSALGGVVNFVTRRPPVRDAKAVRELLVSGSSYREADGVTFIGAPLNDRWGYTLLAAGHNAPILDPDRDAWSDSPRSARFSVRPRLFWSGSRGSRALLTGGLSHDTRAHGTLGGGTPSGIQFLDSLSTVNGDLGGAARFVLASQLVIDVHASTQRLDRNREIGGLRERDRSGTSFADAAATVNRGSLTWLGGVAIRRETNRNLDLNGFDYDFNTGSLFAQVNGEVAPSLSFSFTGRCDRHSRFGSACVPLVAFLARPADGWTARLSGALGSHAPTPFTEETALTGLSRLRPFSGPLSNLLRFERARQGSLDLGYRAGGLDLNASLYAADLFHPVGIRDLPSGPYAQELAIAPAPARMRGVDFFAVYTADPISVTAFYSLLRAREMSLDSPPKRRDVPLSPKRRAGLDIAFDIEETRTRIAVEGYYTGRQFIADDPYREWSKPYTMLEALATQDIGRTQFFLSIENLTNVLQTSYDALLLPAPARSGRMTTDVWAPLSGRVFRIGGRFGH
ncbi:MAG: TonB-dependent receptor [Gemmatimonadota bacterium]|nr:TonB-dependent receptor [Gemmatimonadota bacterium]